MCVPNTPLTAYETVRETKAVAMPRDTNTFRILW